MRYFLNGFSFSLPDEYNQAIHGLEIGLGVGSCGTAAFLNERVIVEDIQAHDYWIDFKDVAASAGLNSCWSYGLHCKITWQLRLNV